MHRSTISRITLISSSRRETYEYKWINEISLYLFGYLVDEISNKVKWSVLANICGELKDVDLDLCNI
jgi:hypothetical protein